MTKGFLLIPALLLGGCGEGGMSTAEIREAAIERARTDMKLDSSVPLDARVWVGKQYDDGPSVCGTVSGPAGSVRPQRFLARTEPFEWLVFEDAHGPMATTQPNKFAEWQTYCAAERV